MKGYKTLLTLLQAMVATTTFLSDDVKINQISVCASTKDIDEKSDFL